MQSDMLLPPTLALVGEPCAPVVAARGLLLSRGVQVHGFGPPGAADALEAAPAPYGFDFYLLADLDGRGWLPGALQRIRQRSDAGVLSWAEHTGSALLEQLLAAGTDMHLSGRPSPPCVVLAVAGVYRRSASAVPAVQAWRLDATGGQLIAPGGASIGLSPTDVCVLQCLLEARGATVSRAALSARLGKPADHDPNLLQAAIYRLRRRIERATLGLAPLQARSRQGYVFKAALLST